MNASHFMHMQIHLKLTVVWAMKCCWAQKQVDSIVRSTNMNLMSRGSFACSQLTLHGNSNIADRHRNENGDLFADLHLKLHV